MKRFDKCCMMRLFAFLRCEIVSNRWDVISFGYRVERKSATMKVLPPM